MRPSPEEIVELIKVQLGKGVHRYAVIKYLQCEFKIPLYEIMCCLAIARGGKGELHSMIEEAREIDESLSEAIAKKGKTSESPNH